MRGVNYFGTSIKYFGVLPPPPRPFRGHGEIVNYFFSTIYGHVPFVLYPGYRLVTLQVIKVKPANTEQRQNTNNTSLIIIFFLPDGPKYCRKRFLFVLNLVFC